jgi:hypothetical protein
VKRHLFDADPESDSNFYVNADPGPDPDCNRNDADPHADPTPRLAQVGKSEFSFTFSPNIASLQRFVILISVEL